jgi:predicted AAA+ superfamily ATPase
MSFIYTTFMPHLRKRHILTQLKKLTAFWPVVGLLGPRQSGKSTIFRDLLGIDNLHTLDDETTLDDVRSSAKNFLLKVHAPVVIDEAQKAPQLFDAIKLLVDRKKRPGSYLLTGSSHFSAKLGIRESLTGRIGLIRLYPFTLSEAHQLELSPERASPLHRLKPRFKAEDALAQLSVGGLPVPLFTRDHEQRRQYFRLWLETAIVRDAARVYGRAYDPDATWSILRQMGAALREGELPTLKHFKQGARKLRRYLEALEEIFVLRKLPRHEAGTGSDA